MRAIRHARKRHAGKCGGVKEVENAIECQVFHIILISSRRYVFLGCPDTRSLGLIPRHNVIVINYSSRLKSEEATASSASMLVTPLTIRAGKKSIRGFTTWKAKVCTVDGVKRTLLLDAGVLHGPASLVFPTERIK